MLCRVYDTVSPTGAIGTCWGYGVPREMGGGIPNARYSSWRDPLPSEYASGHPFEAEETIVKNFLKFLRREEILGSMSAVFLFSALAIASVTAFALTQLPEGVKDFYNANHSPIFNWPLIFILPIIASVIVGIARSIIGIVRQRQAFRVRE